MTAAQVGYVCSHVFGIISPQVTIDLLIATPEKVIPNSYMNGACHSDLDITVQTDVEAKLTDLEALFPKAE